MKTTRHNTTVCVCGMKLDASTDSQTDQTPSEGDVTVCIHCGQIHRYQADLSLVPIELNEIDDDDTKQTILTFRKLIHHRLN